MIQVYEGDGVERLPPDWLFEWVYSRLCTSVDTLTHLSASHDGRHALIKLDEDDIRISFEQNVTLVGVLTGLVCREFGIDFGYFSRDRAQDQVAAHLIDFVRANPLAWTRVPRGTP